MEDNSEQVPMEIHRSKEEALLSADVMTCKCDPDLLHRIEFAFASKRKRKALQAAAAAADEEQHTNISAADVPPSTSAAVARDSGTAIEDDFDIFPNAPEYKFAELTAEEEEGETRGELTEREGTDVSAAQALLQEAQAASAAVHTGKHALFPADVRTLIFL